MARNGGTIDPPANNETDFRKAWEADAKWLADLQATSDALPDGEIVGALLKWQRGDGYAFYLVINDNPLTVSRVKFGDNWSVEPALIRGLRRRDIEDMLAHAKRFAALFGHK